MTGTTRRRRAQQGPLSSPTLVGSILLMIAAIGVVLSYNASRGLPYVPTYEIAADVPDAAELVAGGSEVRLGGARVGLVDQVDAMPATNGRPAFARLRLKLDVAQTGLPRDTKVQVRPRSVLGAKYLDLQPGRSPEELPAGAVLPLENAQPIVEFDEAFDIFDDETSKGLRGTVSELGEAVTGRGSDLNETIAEARKALPPIGRLLRRLADPDTDLDGFVRGAADAAEAVAATAPELGGFLRGAAGTSAALDRSGNALPAAIDALPPAEVASTRALRAVTPVLDDAAVLARALRPGTRALPRTTRGVAALLRDGTPVLRRTPAFADRLGGTLRVLGRVAKDPDAAGSLRQLLATVTTLRTTLATLEPAQVHCNVGGLWAKYFGAAFADANSLGHFLNGQLVIDPQQTLPSSRDTPNLHANPTPISDATECEAGNEPYEPGRQIGNPEGKQGTSAAARAKRTTRPPAASVRRARAAGLLTPVPGAGR